MGPFLSKEITVLWRIIKILLAPARIEIDLKGDELKVLVQYGNHTIMQRTFDLTPGETPF